MNVVVDIVSYALIVGGAVFCVIGGIGMIRLPDFYARTHASGMTDTLGASLLLIGLAIQSGPNLVAVKILLVMFFVVATSPMSGHALAKAAYSHGLKPQLAEDRTATNKEGESSST